MRKRFQTILLAAGLSAALLSGCVYASDTGVTEAAVEMAADEAEKAVSEAVETAATEAEKAQAEAGADAAQAALKEPAAVTGDGLFTTYYGAYEQQIEQVLSSLSDMTDEQISAAIRAGSKGSVIIATWDSVREDLGKFLGVSSYDVDESDSVLTYVLDAQYEDADAVGSKVKVRYAIDMTGREEETVNWDVKETIGRSVRKAGLNTLIGLGIVFVVLMFLTFLIGQIHWIPDILNGRKKKEEAAAPAAPAPAPVPAAVEESVDETDDLELVAVISAAIAASEDVPADGFVVRSIRRRGRKSNWQNA